MRGFESLKGMSDADGFAALAVAAAVEIGQ